MAQHAGSGHGRDCAQSVPASRGRWQPPGRVSGTKPEPRRLSPNLLPAHAFTGNPVTGRGCCDRTRMRARGQDVWTDGRDLQSARELAIVIRRASPLMSPDIVPRGICAASHQFRGRFASGPRWTRAVSAEKSGRKAIHLPVSPTRCGPYIGRPAGAFWTIRRWNATGSGSA